MPVINLYGGLGEHKSVMMDDRFLVKFKQGKYADELMKKIKPTEEQVNNLYVD